MEVKTSLNYAQKTNFIAGCPQIPGMEFYIHEVSLPGISLDLQETKTFGMTKYVAANTHSYGGLSFSVLIDEDFVIYDKFFTEIVNAESLVNGTYAQIEFDFYVQVYNNKGKLLFTEFFKNCMVESIGDVSLSSTDSAVTNTFDVAFKFDWLEIQRDGLPEDRRKEWNIYPKLKPKCCECCNDSSKETENVP